LISMLNSNQDIKIVPLDIGSVWFSTWAICLVWSVSFRFPPTRGVEYASKSGWNLSRQGPSATEQLLHVNVLEFMFSLYCSLFGDLVGLQSGLPLTMDFSQPHGPQGTEYTNVSVHSYQEGLFDWALRQSRNSW